jgi:hypothetical protein
MPTRRRVLIAGDDPDASELLGTTLNLAGYRTDGRGGVCL